MSGNATTGGSFNRVSARISKGCYCLTRQKLEEIEAFSKLIGLPVLERVARDVQNCIEVYDPVALSGTMSRLLRMGEQSLTAIWDLQDRMH